MQREWAVLFLPANCEARLGRIYGQLSLLLLRYFLLTLLLIVLLKQANYTAGVKEKHLSERYHKHHTRSITQLLTYFFFFSSAVHIYEH